MRGLEEAVDTYLTTKIDREVSDVYFKTMISELEKRLQSDKLTTSLKKYDYVLEGCSVQTADLISFILNNIQKSINMYSRCLTSTIELCTNLLISNEIN